MIEVINGVRSEIQVDAEGKGSITKNGLCVLLGISRSSFRADRPLQKLAEILVVTGFSYADLVSNDIVPDVAVACIIEYYAFEAQKISSNAKVLYRAFAAVGVRAWFQDVMGYQKPKPQSQYESFVQARDAFNQMIAVMDYAKDKPGQQRINDFALENTGQCLPGLLTIDDILTKYPREFSSEEKSAIGMYAATAYRNLTGEKPAKVMKRYVNSNGTPQSSRVSAYPLDFLPIIENAIELGFNS